MSQVLRIPTTDWKDKFLESLRMAVDTGVSQFR